HTPHSLHSGNPVMILQILLPRHLLACLAVTGLFAAGVITRVPAATTVQPWQSALVHYDPATGALRYTADAEGNRIPDFSHAGYRGADVPLPDLATIPVLATLEPAPGDNTARLQAALDALSSYPIDPATGRRGALLLAPGIYELRSIVHIRHSGIVLLGSGSGDDPAHDTLLRRTGTDTNPVLTAGGVDRHDKFRTPVPGTRTGIVTPRVIVGSRTFAVADAAPFSTGDTVIVEHPVTEAWIQAVEGGGTDTDPAWQIGEREAEMTIRYLRHITAIGRDDTAAQPTLTLDAPVYNHLDRALGQSTVYKYDTAPLLTEIGVARLRIDIETAGEQSEDHARDALVFRRALDCWARDVTALHFVAAGIKFGPDFARGTALDCRALEPHSRVTGARRYNFCVFQAQLVLFENCHATRARHAFISNGTTLDSGIVFLDCTNDASTAPSEGHRRWPQALLFDGLTTRNPVGNPAILGLYNRGSWGAGHGWAAAHSVAWRCDTDGRRLIIQKPPTAQNYAIGCTGNVESKGYFPQPAGHMEGSNRPGLEPRSLYRAQLTARIHSVNTNP
ncbi:MAG: peptidoglycan-binding protein, partial [Opitutaceae bacterium]|nr:peptidoglycan-binding protein [Opitutaceae bacterium]